MWEKLDWLTITGESLSGLVSGVISGFLILGVTYIINIFDNKRKKQAEKEFLLAKEEIKNVGELRKRVDDCLILIDEIKKSDSEVSRNTKIKNILDNSLLIIELIYMGMFNDENFELLSKENEPIHENILKISVKKDDDLLDTITEQLIAFKITLMRIKKVMYLKI